MGELVRAAMVLHKRYCELPFAVRLHILIRYLTCPFLRVLRFVPRGGRVLEVGGGHGVFAELAADRGSRAFIIEPDLRKLIAARGGSAVTHVAGFDDAMRGTFDTVAVLDVLYAIPVTEWDALLTRLHQRVRPGGVLVIKEMNPQSWKQRWNRLQESLSMRFLRITYARAFNYEPPETFAARLRSYGFESVIVVPVDAWYPHPHLLFVAKKGT